jgi:hypothetical protein
MRQSKPQLPMYKSRFRKLGPLVSAVDVCNKTATDLFSNNRQCVVTGPLRSPFPNQIFERFLWGELFTVACGLQGLTYMLDLHMHQPSQIGPIQREFFEDTFAAVQHSLVSFQYPTPIRVLPSENFYRQNCWGVAAMVYLNSAIRCWDKSSGLVKLLVAQLISSVRAANLPSMWSSSPEILLWIVFVGCCAACDKIDRGWFLLEIRQGVKLLELRSINELEDLLRSLLYRENIYRLQLYTIWEEINE